jgi:MYXO-CTERM domain-containing protein
MSNTAVLNGSGGKALRRWRELTLGLGLAAATSLVQSETMSPYEVVMAYESMVVDLDAQVLAQELELAPGSEIRYASLWTDDGWTGRLSLSSTERRLDVIYQGRFSPDSGRSWSMSLHSDWYEDGMAYGMMDGSTSFALATPSSTPEIVTLGGNGRGGGGCVKCQNGVTEPVDLGPLPLNLFGDRLGLRVAAGVGVAGAVSLVEIGVSAGKDFNDRVFYASADVRVLTVAGFSLARDALVFELDQRTMQYQSANEWALLYIINGRRIINKGQLVDDPVYPPGSPGTGDVLRDPTVDPDPAWPESGDYDGSPAGSINAMTLTVSTVPEPASAAMWLSGLTLLGLGIRRRRGSNPGREAGGRPQARALAP